MSNENNTQGMGAHIWKYFILLTIVWTLVVVVSLAWNWFSEWEGANESASVHARSEFARMSFFVAGTLSMVVSMFPYRKRPLRTRTWKLRNAKSRHSQGSG